MEFSISCRNICSFPRITSVSALVVASVWSNSLHMTNRQYQELRGLSCHFWFGLQQGRLCNSDLSGLKLSDNIAYPCSKLLCTEVREEYQIKYLGSRLFMFRTWIVRWHNTIWVCKLPDIVTNLCSAIHTKSKLNVIHILESLNNINLE